MGFIIIMIIMKHIMIIMKRNDNNETCQIFIR